MRKADLTGKMFGNLEVLNEAPKYISPKGYEKSMWNCLCHACGSKCVVMGSHLTTGHSTSCGCQRIAKLVLRKAGDLTGHRFGMLKVKHRMPNRQVGDNSRVVWHCRCDCGRETDVLALLLQGGLVKSCGCLSVSHAERVMADYLTKYGVPFEAEYAPEDLYGVNGGSLKFDFLVHAQSGVDVLVELDGIQHKQPVKYFGGDRKYLVIKSNDALKDAWALDREFKLIRIDVSSCCSDHDFTGMYDKFLLPHILS